MDAVDETVEEGRPGVTAVNPSAVDEVVDKAVDGRLVDGTMLLMPLLLLCFPAQTSSAGDDGRETNKLSLHFASPLHFAPLIPLLLLLPSLSKPLTC